jgi:hypothetical protein
MNLSRVVGVMAPLLLPCVVLAQQNPQKWEEGVVARVDVALFEGSHVDKPGHVSIFRATGCTYIKKCGWLVTLEVRQTDRKLILEKKIPVHNRIASMHYEDVNLREGDHVRLHLGERSNIFVLLDRDDKPHDFSLRKTVVLASQSDLSRPEPSVSDAASTEIANPQTKTPSRGTLGIVASDWEQSGFMGVEITDISEDGSAALAGLHKGNVITEVNGKKLSSVQDLSSLMGQIEPGTKVSIVYLVRTNLGWMPNEAFAILAKETGASTK